MDAKSHTIPASFGHVACYAAMLVASLVLSDQAQAKFRVLYAFNGTQGGNPLGSLTADNAGTLYGTTAGGGTAGEGTVFKLSADGQQTVLYNFTGGADGGEPDSSVIQDAAGNLFGTTQFGGNDACPDGGCGTVFKITPDGKETVLYAFKGGSDGAVPSAGLIADNAGNFYGTTYNGGAFSNGGTVFMVQPNGVETILYSFGKGNDGAGPVAGLLLDASGNLYGTTLHGGASSGGTVFRLAPDGTEKVIYSFTGGPDGGGPMAAPILDKQGNLYGTASGGGNTACGANGCGVVYKLTPKGTESVLYAFSGGSDGANPYGALSIDKTGNLYGTTRDGGLNQRICHTQGCGTLFKLALDGTKTTLRMFKGRKDGGWPMSDLLNIKGHLFGVAYLGGDNGGGTLYEFAP